MTRVVVLDHTGALGGAELALVRVCEHLPRTVEIRVVLFSDGPLRGLLEKAGVTVDVVALDDDVVTTDRTRVGRLSLRTLRGAVRLVPFSWRLARHVRSLRADVVHTTSLKADVLGIVPAAVARRPLVWHVHDRIAPDYLPGPVARAFRGLSRVAPDAVVVNSRATAGTLPRVTRVVHPGFAPEQRSDAAHHPRSPREIALIGRISPTKGQLEAVRALPAVLAVAPDAQLRLVGEPAFGAEDYAESVHAEVRRLGLGSSVTFVGFVPDTRAELDRASVCLHASPVPEPFGQVVVEAMVRGVPVVATRAGGVEEIMQDPEVDGPLGVLVDPGDPAALAAGLCQVLAAPQEARADAARARESALRRFPVARTVEGLTEVWDQVSRRRAGSRSRRGRPARPAGSRR